MKMCNALCKTGKFCKNSQNCPKHRSNIFKNPLINDESSLSILPSDILISILANLDIKSIINFGQCSRSCRAILGENYQRCTGFDLTVLYILYRDMKIYEENAKYLYAVSYHTPWFNIKITKNEKVKVRFNICQNIDMYAENKEMSLAEALSIITTKLKKSRELRNFTFGSIGIKWIFNLAHPNIDQLKQQLKYSHHFAPVTFYNLYCSDGIF